VHEKYIALKLCDVRKTNGARDHVVLQICDRELFADFLMDYAEKRANEVIFEQNEEFSMIINKSPVWFSFDDVERHKKQEIQRQFKSQDITGFLEMRQNKAINYFKMMFSKNANWAQRYLALQGFKLYVYQGQKYNKPTKIIELTEDLEVAEVRRADANGKDYVLALTTGTTSSARVTEWLAAATESQYNKWLKAFKSVREQFAAIKQRAKDKLEEDVA